MNGKVTSVPCFLINGTTTVLAASGIERVTELSNTLVQGDLPFLGRQMGVAVSLNEEGNMVSQFSFLGYAGENVLVAESRDGAKLFSAFAPKQINNVNNVLVILDKNNNLMSGQTGARASDKSKSIVVQNPGNSNQYYIVTNDINNNTIYHVVDMSLNDGLGQVISKNNMVPHTAFAQGQQSKIYNNMMAVVEDHSGNYSSKLFLMENTKTAAQTGFSSFVSLDVTANGFSSPQVIKTFGQLMGGGELQISPNGSELALFYYTPSSHAFKAPTFSLLTYTFNNYSYLTAEKYLSFGYQSIPASLDYTASGNALYVSTGSFWLNNAKLQRFTPSLNTTGTTILSSNGVVRRAKDGKMNFIKTDANNKYLTRISNPDGASSTTDLDVLSFLNSNKRTLKNSLPLQTHKIYSSQESAVLFALHVGDKVYELKDHLGNVRVTVGDRKLQVQQASPDLVLETSFEGDDAGLFQSNADGHYVRTSAEKTQGNYSLKMQPQNGNDAYGPNIRKEVKENDEVEIFCNALWYGTAPSERGGGIAYMLIDKNGNYLYPTSQGSNNSYGLWREITINDVPNVWEPRSDSWTIPVTYDAAGNLYGDSEDEKITLVLFPWVANGFKTTYFDDLRVSVHYANAQDIAVADVQSVSDYYPFGMEMPNRKYSGTDYRYGQNGQEKTPEIDENHYTAMYWEYDSRLGRRWNLDPKGFAGISEYACFNNNPIVNIDVQGDIFVAFNAQANGVFQSCVKLTFPDNEKLQKLLLKSAVTTEIKEKGKVVRLETTYSKVNGMAFWFATLTMSKESKKTAKAFRDMINDGGDVKFKGVEQTLNTLNNETTMGELQHHVGHFVLDLQAATHKYEYNTTLGKSFEYSAATDETYSTLVGFIQNYSTIKAESKKLSSAIINIPKIETSEGNGFENVPAQQEMIKRYTNPILKAVKESSDHIKPSIKNSMDEELKNL